MRLLNRPLLVLLMVLLVAGCGLFRDSSLYGKGTKLSKEIAGLPELNLEPIAIADGKVKDLIATEEEILAAYRAVYGKVGDPDQNRELGKRLADLELARAEMLVADGDSAKPFASAVDLYEGLLSASSDSEDRDSLLYQLAQANDMAGDSEQTLGYLNELIADFPDSPHVLEARFRRAEMRFSNGDFNGAVDDYSEVTQAGDSTKYWLHASYMLGWSLFKRTDLEAAADQFYQIVEITTEDAPRLAAQSATEAENGAPDARARVSKELLDDALRVLMLTLNYEEGAKTLASDMAERDRPEWQYLVYERMAADHIEQERYLDGVATWQVFVDENPLDERAPSATVASIGILEEGDFPSEIQPKKEEFVARYGVRSDYWKAHDAVSRESYIATLRTYLDELSQFRHAQAQSSLATEDYLAAADYYEQTMETFPKDPKLFLLGDLYTDAAMAQPALAAYQRLTKEFPKHPQAADAGYSSILALDSLKQSTNGDEQVDWADKHLEAQIDFAMIFADDPRATTVQASVADQLFRQGEFEDAIELAGQLLAKGTDIQPQVRDNARLILGHSSMELERYVAAESAYTQYLAEAPQGTVASAEVRERLLASVYKQGEAAEAVPNTNAALRHYLRIAELGPGSEIAALAHYDAIAMMEQAKNSTAVASLLGSFRDLYPNDPRVAEVPGRLASMFEENRDYSGAAQEYLNVAAASSDPEKSRQAHYLAAELFLKDGDKRSALREFNNYAKAYEKPYDVNMAALDIQDTLLEELGGSRVDLWRRKVNVRNKAGRKADERMNYLAAEASLQLADISRREFDSIQLTQPLKNSLRAKQASLKGTINAYKQVIDYGVGDFVTAASYQVADMYVHLSRSIMDSSRPSGLSALELEQYEILLEEQAFPFEEQAIELHEVNLQRMWKGTNDEWTDRSLGALRVLMPGRFDKDEVQVAYVDVIH